MSTVIHALWVGEDAVAADHARARSRCATAKVNAELTQYLQDSWKAIIDADVDGPNSEPARIDNEKPLFGQRSLTKRLARTVFFGAAPTIAHVAHKGIETQRVFLGTAVPGDVPGNFHSALNQLGRPGDLLLLRLGQVLVRPPGQHHPHRQGPGRAPAQGGCVGRDRATARRTRRRTRGDFAGVHVCPETNADIPDTDEARLVILHPKVAAQAGHRLSGEGVRAEGDRAPRQRATARNRNMLVFLAADEAAARRARTARHATTWAGRTSSTTRPTSTSPRTRRTRPRSGRRRPTRPSTSRLLQTFTWALVPTQPDPGAPFLIRETKVEGSRTSLAERVSRRLGNDGDLSTRQAAATIRLAIGKVPQIWKDGHVSLGALWALYSQYPYMPRLRDRRVLNEGIVDMPMIWQTMPSLSPRLRRGAAGTSGCGPGRQGRCRQRDRLAPPRAPRHRRTPSARRSCGAVNPGDQGRRDPPAPELGPGAIPRDHVIDLVYPRAKVRYFGVKTLNADKIALDFRNVAEEVIAHLRADPSTRLTVRIEIEATDDGGFDEGKVRTVSENASTLKFDQSGFEES